ncbi:hypothetical protein H4219_005803 [Mycoemilia scoparia]|uniref:Uncharacterized protein n=1 Tax=Mycoemilia scoparia TaxID=417184 RepID=A0A9W7ZS30_9FUNG|nr:hypothetical protein H4219_005803 [Mycoemilia scoparia]
MQSARDALSHLNSATLLMATVYLKDTLFYILCCVCHTNGAHLIKEVAVKLKSIKSSPDWKENPNINEYILGIKQAAQLLIDQAKEYSDAHGLTKNDQSASGTDHDRVLYGVTTDDCLNLFGQIKDIANPILGTIDVHNLSEFYEKVLRNDIDAAYSDHVVQKILECIASEPVDITDSVKAITFDVDGKVVNLEDHINNLVDKPPSVDDVIEQLSDLALTAKDELEFAEEARNTVYYNEEKLNAQKAIENMNSSYSGLLTKLSTDAERAEVNKRIGMKIKEIQTSWELMTALDLE